MNQSQHEPIQVDQGALTEAIHQAYAEQLGNLSRAKAEVDAVNKILITQIQMYQDRDKIGSSDESVDQSESMDRNESVDVAATKTTRKK